jgi:hypothetical protein
VLVHDCAGYFDLLGRSHHAGRYDYVRS